MKKLYSDGGDDMTTAHTPGPWEAVVSKAFGLPLTRISKTVADLVGDGHSSHYIATVAVFRDQQEANARLIAAAPDLLDALRDAISAVQIFHGHIDWETYRNHSPEMKRWNAAIAKATTGDNHD